ncbi:hypothetical protein R6V09_13880 [Streptomyces sp. W16]|uniref:hypothetical protein n=1 Tax=Streptomyces sp. W16 TaxID=3076631 RepID=UPI00295C0B53|nr:hypothetical protein [Streptomyces sp. W16]MDV9171211.1 hypothetical protein [Streptomyces sp. W16]
MSSSAQSVFTYDPLDGEPGTEPLATLRRGALLSAVDQANDAVDAAHNDWYALARSAAVLGRTQYSSGDSELAVAAYDQAVRLYNDNSRAMGRGEDAATGLATLVDCAGRAMLLHHRQGRRKLADSAFDVGRLFAEFLAGNRLTAPASQLLGRRAAVVQRTGQPRSGLLAPEILSLLDPQDTLREATWAVAEYLDSPGPHTLAEALRATGAESQPWATHLAGALTVDGGRKEDCWSPTLRGSHLGFLPNAAQAVSGALGDATGTAGDGWRLTGREIHMCYSVASGRGELRFALKDHAEYWGGLLLALGKDALRAGHTSLASDCGDWLRGVLTQAAPHTLIAPWGQKLHAGAQQLPS